MNTAAVILSIPGSLVGWTCTLRSVWPRWVWIMAFASWTASAWATTAWGWKIFCAVVALAVVPCVLRPDWLASDKNDS